MRPTSKQAEPAGPLDVLIIGTGFAGLGMAIKLREAGRPSFVVLEKTGAVGGTWRDNTYPGCACDVASLMYSYSFAPKRNWTRMYAEQPEILCYIQDIVADYDLEPHIRFHAEAISYEFDETTDLWCVRTRSGDEYHARIVVMAHGALHVPHSPDFPGQERFSGPVFHSAQWDHSVDLTGKRVAVIGTGSSAAQFIPAIAERTSHVDVYQRNAHWVLPKADRTLSRLEHRLFRTMPFLQWVYRNIAYWTHEVPVLAFMNPKYLKVLELASKRLLAKQVPDLELRAKLTPNYTIGCKRILLSNDYYPALVRDDVELITEGIDEFVEDGIRTKDGQLHEADVVILGTGFSTDNRCAHEHIVGRGGVTIQQAWRDGMTAYLGMAVAGFPNLFMVMGPNSGGGAQSILFVIEAQLRYIARCLELMSARQATRMEVRAQVQREFNVRLHGKLARSVWNTGGCHSWFLDHTGHNRQSWPGTGTGYWRATRRPDPNAFALGNSASRQRTSGVLQSAGSPEGA